MARIPEEACECPDVSAVHKLVAFLEDEKQLERLLNREGQFIQNCLFKAAELGCLRYSPEEQTTDPSHHKFVVPSLTIFPSIMSRNVYENAAKLNHVIMALIDNLTCDPSFVVEIHRRVCEVDDFTRRLCMIASDVYIPKNGNVTPLKNIGEELRLHIIRSDYMIVPKKQISLELLETQDSTMKRDDCICMHNITNRQLKQVEVNVIAASFATLCDKVTTLHKLNLEALVSHPYFQHRKDFAKFSLNDIFLCHMKQNPLSYISDSFRAAHENYIRRYVDPDYCPDSHKTDHSVGMMIVVCDFLEPNRIDQNGVSLSLRGLDFYSFRVTLQTLVDLKNSGDLFICETYPSSTNLRITQISECNSISNRRLWINQGGEYVEISVTYYRAGYAPDHYVNESHWEIRHFLELSDTVKCPSVITQLCGTKKMQAVWTNKQMINKYLTDEQYSFLSQSFGVQVDPSECNDDTYTSDVVSDALKNPDAYVLKPQREGGGNNIFGTEILKILQLKDGCSQAMTDLKKYILMERYMPLPHSTLVYGKHEFDLESNPSYAQQSELATERTAISVTANKHTNDGRKMDERYSASEKIKSKFVQHGVKLQKCVSELGIYGAALCLRNVNDDYSRYIYERKCAGSLLRTKSSDANEGGICIGASALDSPFLVD